MDVRLPRLLQALNGYLGWTLQYGPPSRTHQALPPEFNIRKVLPRVPESDPFFDLDKAIRDSLLEILDGYEHRNATPFSQASFRSLLTGLQSLYVEKVQIRISENRLYRRARETEPEEG